MEISKCNLSVRALLVLKSMDITTEEQLKECWLASNKSIETMSHGQRNFGKRSKAEIEDYCIGHFNSEIKV